MDNLRVGIIVDDTDQAFLTYDLYSRSLKSSQYSVECLVVQKSVRIENDSLLCRFFRFLTKWGVRKLIARVMFSAVDRFESRIASKNPRFKEFFAKHDLSKFAVPKIYVNPIVSPSGLAYRYSPEDVQAIGEAGLDVLIRAGSGILRGPILQACRLGVISFHHGDNNFYRGGPPAFWEVFNREPSTGFVIQRLRPELDGGDVIFKGSIATSFLYKINLCRIYVVSAVFLHQVLERLSGDPSFFDVHQKVPYAHPLHTAPTSFQVFQYLRKTFFHGIGRLAKKLSNKRLRWGVAFQFTEDWKDAVLWKSTSIVNPPFRFLADPFPITHNGKTVLFVEDYDYRIARGKISAYELAPGEYKELGVALEEEFHLSFPFLFRVEDDIYMVPETHQNNDIRLYKCIDFPLHWELAEVLLEGFSAADSLVFAFENRWWIFTNKDSSELGDHGSQLHIFYSDSLHSGSWLAHPANPVIFDSTRARNAGLVSSSEGLFRVFQRQGFDMYGESMGVSRVIELTPQSYKEEVLFGIPPKFMKDIRGTHTYSFDSGVLCVDFVKYSDYRD